MTDTAWNCFTRDGLHKRIYHTKDDAKKAARGATARGGRPVRPYRGGCGYWHLGSSPKQGVDVSALVPHETHDLLCARASADSVSLAEIVRRALHEYLT